MTVSTEATYEFQVAGHLDDHWATRLGGLTLNRRSDGTTTLTGPIADQAHLHGVLARVRDLGAPLLTLRVLDVEGCSPPAPHAAAHPTLAHPLTTERLILRPATPDDAASTWTYRRDEAVGEWIAEVTQDLETYRERFTEPSRLAATVIVEREGMLIGDFMLRVQDAWAQADVADRARRRQAELGWVLDPAHTGHGYGTEAVRALLTYCFSELGVRRVVAQCAWTVMGIHHEPCGNSSLSGPSGFVVHHCDAWQ